MKLTAKIIYEVTYDLHPADVANYEDLGGAPGIAEANVEEIINGADDFIQDSLWMPGRSTTVSATVTVADHKAVGSRHF